MTITARRTAASAIVATLVILLSGCSLLATDTGPTRNAAGQITASAKVDVTDLLAGDCFSSADKDFGSAPVTAVPCAKPHTFRVIQTGAATPAQIAKDGSLQNLMSVACKKAFGTFAATVKGDTRPELQFLVYSASDPDSGAGSNAKKDTRQHYTCIANEPAVSTAKG